VETVLTFFDKGKVILATILYSVASFFFYLLKKRGAVPRTTVAPVPTTLTAVPFFVITPASMSMSHLIKQRTQRMIINAMKLVPSVSPRFVCLRI